MPGETVIEGFQPIEYVNETDQASFATGAADSVGWNWFGIVNSWSVDQGVESESITYLPEYNGSNKLERRVNVKLREMYSADVTFHPQSDFSILEFWTGSTTGLSDDVPSIQVGEANESLANTEFRRLLGGVGEEVTLSVEEDGVAEIDGNFIFAEAEDWSTSDYVNTGNGGSHASEDTTTPWTFNDLGSVKYGGSDLSGNVESIELTISNELAEVRDSNSSNSTQLDAIVPVDREITVDVDLTYSDFDMLTDVTNYNASDFTFTLGNTDFTVNNVKFPEHPYEYTPDDLVSDSLSSDPAPSTSGDVALSWT
jgi:hypothetical protein